MPKSSTVRGSEQKMWDATRKRLTVVATRETGKDPKKAGEPVLRRPLPPPFRLAFKSCKWPPSPVSRGEFPREPSRIGGGRGTEGGLVECPVIRVSVRYLRGVRSGWKRMKNSIRRCGRPRAKHWSLRDAADVCRQTKREKKKALTCTKKKKYHKKQTRKLRKRYD